MTSNKKRDNPDILVKVYKATIELMVESHMFDLPYLTNVFFAHLKLQENSIIIKSISRKK